MTQEEHMDQRIDNYLTGRMHGEERAAFEAEMASNSNLREEVELQKLVMGAVVQFRKQELKDYIREHTVEEQRQRSTGPMWMSIAAAIVIAVGAGFYIFYFKDQQNISLKGLAVETPKNQPNGPAVSAPAMTDSTLSTASAPIVSGKNNSKPPQGKAEEKFLNDDSTPLKDLKSEKPPQAAKTEILSDKSVVLKKKSEGFAEDKGAGIVVTRKDSRSLNFSIPASDKIKSRKGYIGSYSDSSNIRQDVLLKDTVVMAKELTEANETYYISGERRTKDSFVNIEKPVSVKYYSSAVNFKGYIFNKKILSLYGVSTDERPEIRLLHNGQDAWYMKINGKVFSLKDENYYYDFSSPVTDKKRIKTLGF